MRNADNENQKKEIEIMKEFLYKIIGSSDEEDDVSPPTKKRKL